VYVCNGQLSLTTVLSSQLHHPRSKVLKCNEGKCEEFNLAHLGFLHFTHYTISVAFSGLEKYELKDIIFYVSMVPKHGTLFFSSVEWFMNRTVRSYHIRVIDVFVVSQFKSYNPAFTQLELWFRIVFLVCAAGILVSIVQSFQRVLNQYSNCGFYVGA
jgi:hypothetical protein